MDAQKLTEFEALKEIDFSDPSILFALATAAIGDVTFFLIITHYIAALFVGFILFPKMRGFSTKVILVIGMLIPGPLFLLGSIAIAIIWSNKLVEYAILTAVIVAEAAAAATGVGAVADVAVDAAAAAVKEVGEKVVEKGVEKVVEKGAQKVAEKAVQKGAETMAQKGIQTAAKETVEKGTEKVAQKGVEKATEGGAKKTIGQKIKERGMERVRGRQKDLGRELFGKKEGEKEGEEEGGSSISEPLILRSQENVRKESDEFEKTA